MARKRFRWNEETGHLEEVGLDYKVPERLPVFGDAHYDGLRATDGTPIDTKAKHRQYMRDKGLTTIDDYTQTWKKQEEQRQEIRTTGGNKAERREAIGRTIYQLEQRNRNKRR